MPRQLRSLKKDKEEDEDLPRRSPRNRKRKAAAPPSNCSSSSVSSAADSRNSAYEQDDDQDSERSSDDLDHLSDSDICVEPEDSKPAAIPAAGSNIHASPFSLCVARDSLGAPPSPLDEDDTDDDVVIVLDASSQELARKPAAVDLAADDTDDDVLTVAEAPSDAAAAAAASLAHDINEDVHDDEVQIIGHTGKNALEDFPHARFHCSVHSFVQMSATAASGGSDSNNETFCPNCYCYVCDNLASTCVQWHKHCHAHNQDAQWTQARLQVQQQRTQPGEAPSSSQYNYYSPSSYCQYYPRYTARRLLDSVTRVYDKEVTPPPAFVTPLKHYQKQSLAFMLHVEDNVATAASLGARTATSPPAGWLCDDVGMGKSAVVIALVVTNPLPQPPSLVAVKEARYIKGEPLAVKATLILTSVSLLGQWQDEICRHAPTLTVYRYHPSSGYKLKMADLHDADIVLTTATVKMADCFVRNYEFRRVVVDEGHLLGTSSARLEYAQAYWSPRRWSVTATPFSSSTEELSRQCTFLGLPLSVAETPNSLREHMIRHTKAQRIGGAEALALPASTTRVKLLDMATWEQGEYKKSYSVWDPHSSSRRVSNVQLQWYTPLALSLIRERSTKINALMVELKALLQRDANMRACIFTQFRRQQELVQLRIQQDLGKDLKVYTFHGGTGVKYREKYIREFQSLTHSGPAVFLITFRAGSVGLTLTAATHVFLMEPCILPSSEVQAAGRIHRLGQTKPVGVTKFVYRDTCECSIVALHEAIQHEGGGGYIEGDSLSYDAGLLLLGVNEDDDSGDSMVS